MTERGAFFLVLLGGVLFEVVAILGLVAAHANEAALSLGLIIPLALTSYLSSRVVMYYGKSRRRRH